MCDSSNFRVISLEFLRSREQSRLISVEKLSFRFYIHEWIHSVRPITTYRAERTSPKSPKFYEIKLLFYRKYGFDFTELDWNLIDLFILNEQHETIVYPDVQ